MPPSLPDTLTVQTASRLRSTAARADTDIVWLETPLDGEFGLIRQRRADAGLGWIDPAAEACPAALEVMTLGEFEPLAWIPAAHRAAPGGTIGLGELAAMDIVHGPRRASPQTYDAWLTTLRGASPRFAFTDPPFRQSLPMTLPSPPRPAGPPPCSPAPAAASWRGRRD